MKCLFIFQMWVGKIVACVLLAFIAFLNAHPTPAKTCQMQNNDSEPSITSSLRKDSLCCWKWKPNIDELRKPRVLKEAVCDPACTKCSETFHGLSCHPEKRLVDVRRRGKCVNGNKVSHSDWYNTTVEIAVACTCAKNART